MSKEQRIVVESLIRSAPNNLDTSFAQIRTAFEGMGEITKPTPAIRFRSFSTGKVNLEVGLAPGSRADRTILYLHGGGYVIGSATSHRGVVSLLGEMAKSRTVFVDYRLAPEFPYPAAIDDALDAYRWLLDQENSPPSQVVFAGDSAGGGLAISTLVRARDEGLPMPAAVAVFSPMVDLAGTGASMTENAERDLMVDRPVFDRMTKAYLNGVDPKSLLASPIYADLRNLPPLLIQVGTTEALLDDSLRLFRCAAMADVAVQLSAEPYMPHFWHIFAGILDEGRASLRETADFFSKHMN